MNTRLPEEFRLRTKKYAAAVIRFYVGMSKTREEMRVLGKQLLRSGTSVAAQVREASRARSGMEFVSKLSGALQEAEESQLWLELLREECGLSAAQTGVEWLNKEGLPVPAEDTVRKKIQRERPDLVDAIE